MVFVANEYSIGSGGDYATFAAYVAAKERDMTSGDGEKDILSVKAGDAGVLDLTGGSWVTSVVCCIEILPEVASEQFDVEDIGDVASAIAACPSIDGDVGMDLGDLNVEIDGLIINCEGGDGDDVGVVMDNASPAVIKNCLVVLNSTHANVDCLGIQTGTGFTGRIINVLVVIEAGSGYSGAVGIDVDCSSLREAVINCTVVGLWNDASLVGVKLSNYAKAINSLSVLSGLGTCWSDIDSLASVEGCGATDGSLASGFNEDNVEDCVESLVYSTLFDTYEGKLDENSGVRKLGSLSSVTGAEVDAFGLERVQMDIGYHQTYLVNGGDLEEIFKDIGSVVMSVNHYGETIPDLIEIGSAGRVSQLDGGVERLKLLQSTLQKDEQNRLQVKNWIQTLVGSVQSYLSGYVKSLMLGVGRNDVELLEELNYWLGINSEKVSSIVRAYNYILDVEDASTLTLTGVVIPEIVNAQRIVVECTSNTTPGSEQWSVVGSERGTFSGSPVTNVAFESTIDKLELMVTITGTAWLTATGYVIGDMRENGDGYYLCTADHTSDADKEPGEGDDWEDYWENYIKEGDKIYLYVTTDQDALFQKFFRDRFGFVFSNSVAGGAETILDSWAE